MDARAPANASAGNITELYPAIARTRASDNFDLRLFMRVLLRRKLVIALVMACLTGFSFIYVNQLTPLYASETLLVLESHKGGGGGLELLSPGLGADPFTIQTEASVAGSRQLAEQAVIRLKLLDNPEYNPAVAGPAYRPLAFWPESVRQFIAEAIIPGLRMAAWPQADRYLHALQDAILAPKATSPVPHAETPQDEAAEAPPEPIDPDLLRQMTDQYLGALTVTPSTRSRIMGVRFVSADPVLAARAANMSADLYIGDQVRTKGEASNRAAGWLSDRVDDAKAQTLAAERRLEEFRRVSGVESGGSASAYAAQLADLNNQTISARTQRSEAESKYQQVLTLQKQPNQIESAGVVLDSGLIQTLRQNEIQAEADLAQMRTELGDGHPRVQLAENKLADMRRRITDEIGKIAKSLGNAADLARQREARIAPEIAAVQSRLNEQNLAEATIRSLESEVRANQQLYDSLLVKLSETRVQGVSGQQADARVISRAIEANTPFSPHKQVILLLAIVGASIVAVVAAFIAEHFHGGFRSIEQLEQMTGVGALGLVPKLLKSDVDILPHRELTERPYTAFAEAIRTIRTGLYLAHGHQLPKTILVTSSIPNEGKSLLALSLATLAANAKQRTVLVDCNLRYPTIHRELGIANEHGLSDYLNGDVALKDIINPIANSPLLVITAGRGRETPSEMLGSARMREMLERLTDACDLVVIDSPPVLAVADALMLVQACDRTVFAVRWESTKRETVRSGLKQVVAAGGPRPNLVLTQVNVAKHVYYSRHTGTEAYYTDRQGLLGH